MTRDKDRAWEAFRQATRDLARQQERVEAARRVLAGCEQATAMARDELRRRDREFDDMLRRLIEAAEEL